MARKKDNRWRNATIVLVIVIAGLFLWSEGYFTPLVDEPDVTTAEWSQFKFVAQTEGSGDSLTGATVLCWWDENGDGRMQYEELGRFSESSGTYTSVAEYPIGVDIWVQVYHATHQLTYSKVRMTGVRNYDGSAKSVGLITAIQTAGFSYTGTINGITWTGSTDYNYTLNGASGFATITMTLNETNRGITSQLWEGVDYQYVYGITRPNPYFIRWSEIAPTGISPTILRAPTFLGQYFTRQDAVDLGPTESYFDFVHLGLTNAYYGAIVNPSWGNLFYAASDPAAPRPVFTFYVSITAAGTSVATYGTCLWQNLTYDQAYNGNWGTTGCLNADGGWAWVA